MQCDLMTPPCERALFYGDIYFGGIVNLRDFNSENTMRTWTQRIIALEFLCEECVWLLVTAIFFVISLLLNG